jgi:hypothetical protein
MVGSPIISILGIQINRLVCFERKVLDKILSVLLVLWRMADMLETTKKQVSQLLEIRPHLESRNFETIFSAI